MDTGNRPCPVSHLGKWNYDDDVIFNNNLLLPSFLAKPIDLLAQYVSSDDNDLEIQMHEPYRILVVSEAIIIKIMFCISCIRVQKNRQPI